jgi:hypothetical protein
VADELMSLVKREAMKAGRDVGADPKVKGHITAPGDALKVIDLFSALEGRFRPRADLLASVIVAGADIGLSKKDWCSILGLRPRTLNGVPKRAESGLLWGFDVGLALEAAVHGDSYRQITKGKLPHFGGDLTERILARCGQQRLAHEVHNAFRDVLDLVRLGYQG